MLDNELSDLKYRRALCQAIIRYLTDIDDPRRDDALTEYRRQLNVIEAKIESIIGKPPPVIVGLKTAVLSLTTNQGV